MASLVSRMKARVIGRSSRSIDTRSRATPFSTIATSSGSSPGTTAPPFSSVIVATKVRISSGAAAGACAAKSALSSSVSIILAGPFLVAPRASA